MLAGGREEKSFMLERENACWRCCSSNSSVQRRDAGCHRTPLLTAGQQLWGRWQQEFASVQAQLGIEALPSPEELSLEVTANGEMFVSKLCTGGKKNPPAWQPQGEQEQQTFSSLGLCWVEHIRSNKPLTAKAPQSMVNLIGELWNFRASSKATNEVGSFDQVKTWGLKHKTHTKFNSARGVKDWVLHNEWQRNQNKIRVFNLQALRCSLPLIIPQRDYQCCGVWFQPHCLAVLENLEHSLLWHPSQEKPLQMPPQASLWTLQILLKPPHEALRSNPAASDFPCNPPSSGKSHRAKAQSKT